MKRVVLLVIFLVIILVSCTGCYNKQLFDVTYHYDRAIVYLPNGEIVEDGGMVGGVYGIVEFEDRVEHVTPTSITFIDEKNSMLHAFNEHPKEK